MQHKFVEFIPPEIEENVLYVSIEYDIAKHKCACGCGADIVTTLSPVRWKLTYDGETVSLNPSIGNWNHACQSHYFIRNDEVVWSGPISDEEIKNVANNDKKSLKEHLGNNSKENRFVQLLKKIFK